MTANVKPTAPKTRVNSRARHRSGEYCLLCPSLSFHYFKALVIPWLNARALSGPLTSSCLFPLRVDLSEDGMKALVTLSSGDMRRALNILQVRWNHCSTSRAAASEEVFKKDKSSTQPTYNSEIEKLVRSRSPRVPTTSPRLGVLSNWESNVLQTRES